MLLSSCFKSIIQTCAITPGLIWTKRVKPRMRYRMYLSISGTTGKRSVCRNPSGGIFFSAIKHRVLNILKHQLVERTHSRLLSEYWDDLLKSGYSEEEQTQLEQIQHILQSLPQQCRIVFMKSCLEGKKYLEIAEELRISVNTVKSHISKAYREIRGKIAVLKNSNLLLLIACATYKEMK